VEVSQTTLTFGASGRGYTLLFLVSATILGLQLHRHGGHPLSGGIFTSLSPREGDYLPLQSGMVMTRRWPHGCHNSCAGEPAPAYRGYDRFSTGSSEHRRRVASGAPAAQQPPSVRSVTLSGRAVTSRCRPAHRHCHQHTTSRGAAPGICAAVARSANGACAIRGASTPSAAKCAPTGTA
jgi:hypothetical protein